jgi:hypothetical protein
MAAKFEQIVLTEGVRLARKHYYGKSQDLSGTPQDDPLTEDKIGFIQSRDSFYMATVSETGWPYIQHRGGPEGFLRVINPSSLAFADYKGNRQLLPTGNLAASDRVTLFLMDYPQRARLKILGHCQVMDARDYPELVPQLADPAVQDKVERLFFIRVVSFDWNCSQHITPRFTSQEITEAVAPLKQRIAELENQLKEKSKT